MQPTRRSSAQAPPWPARKSPAVAKEDGPRRHEPATGPQTWRRDEPKDPFGSGLGGTGLYCTPGPRRPPPARGHAAPRQEADRPGRREDPGRPAKGSLSQHPEPPARAHPLGGNPVSLGLAAHSIQKSALYNRSKRSAL